MSESVGNRLFALFTARRLTVWAAGLFVLTWSLYLHNMATPGYIDRAGRFKASDFIQFYVMGSLAREGRIDALYDSAAHLEEGRRRIDPSLGLYAGHVNYGPQVAVVFAPLAGLAFTPALMLFLCASALAFIASVWLLWRELPPLHPYGAAVAVVAAASPLFAVVIRYGQLSAFTLLLWALALAAFRRGRSFAAGLAIGSLVFKPQFGVVIAVALLAARDWRVVGGAAVAAGVQLLVGWLAAGSDGMRTYVAMLITLARDPGLVQLYPSEVHSVRGFLQLLVPWPAVVTAGTFAGLLAALAAGTLAWRRPAPVELRLALIVLLTVLASPHLLSYDLAVLALTLAVSAAWVVAGSGSPRRRTVAFLLVPLYFAPFSSNLARAVPIQFSVLLMVALAVSLWRAIDAEPVASVR